MEQVIQMVVFAIMGIGLVAVVMGLVGFTRWFDTSPHDAPSGPTAAKGERSS